MHILTNYWKKLFHFSEDKESARFLEKLIELLLLLLPKILARNFNTLKHFWLMLAQRKTS